MQVRTFSSLRQHNFRLFWSGQLLSLMGSSIQSIGQIWLVLNLTHSGWQLGVVGALQALPVLLFTLFGGVFADRWSKRRILLLTQSAAMVQAFLFWLLLITSSVQLWHIYVLALLLGFTNSLDRPTRQAFVVELVGRTDLTNAIGLNSSIANLARIMGPALGGLIIAVTGITTLFLLNALSFLPVLVSLALIRRHELHAQTFQHLNIRQNAWQSLREGMAYVWNTPAVMLVIVVVGLGLLFGSNFGVVLPLFATDLLHVGSAGFGLLSAALGIGSLLSAFWLAWGNQQPTMRRLLMSMLLFCVLEVIFAATRIYLLSFVLIAGVGFTETAFAELAFTVLQMVAPDHLRGRVISVCIVSFDGSLPLGYLLLGWLSEHYGPSLALFIGALLTLLIVGIGWIWRISAEKNMVDSTHF
ncbi:MFS transporter [Dictyobacter arantiisoli]|uniref:MFS transporter n=1 Tax=Dictyobacter arantiisoli TaxID=2014874 RepID=A0A5A5T8F6_9CHLR|nr:MFS transporter [Dictyobacter arantiisoli]